MKIFWLVLLIVVALLALSSLITYLVQRLRQKKAEEKGVVVYATVLSIEKMTGFLAKQVDMRKIKLRVQEPGETKSRDVELRTRVQADQKIEPGHKLIVVIDPSNAKRIYPAGPEASKRVAITGSRTERRAMQGALRNPGRGGPQQPGGYQPPTSAMGGNGRRIVRRG